LGLLVWILTVAKEFLVLKDMVKALHILPRGPTEFEFSGHRMHMSSLGTGRFIYLTVLIFCRGFVASCLLVQGAHYLAVTTSIEDIILNAVALEFILRIDELLYEVMAPVKTRALLLMLEPLRLPDPITWRGLDFDGVAATCACVGFFAVAYLLWVVPELEGMWAAQRELCGGLLDFSYSLTVAGFPVWSQPAPEAPQLLKESSQYDVLRGVVDNAQALKSMHHRVANLTGPGFSVKDISMWSLESLGEKFNPYCADYAQADNSTFHGASNFTEMALSSMRDAANNQSISLSTMCRDMKRHCNSYPSIGSFVRLWCPKTCGCHFPNSTLALPGVETGCPKPCLQSLAFTTALDQHPCIELPKGELTSQSAFKEFIGNYLTASSGFGITAQTFKLIVPMLLRDGCEALPKVKSMFDVDMCSPPSLKPLTWFCPLTCKCNITPGPFCPGAC